MTGFPRRIEVATAFEEKVVAALIERAWRAERFGQGQLTEEMRQVIRWVETPVRYMPDIIAAKRFKVLTRIAFVDAKAGKKWKKTGNHAIEIAALDGADKWQQYSGCDTYFVFSNAWVPQLVDQLVHEKWA